MIRSICRHSGVQAFASSTVDEQFKLSNDQKSKIREIVEASRSSFAGAYNKDASEQERTDARNKMAATQKENMTKVQALLTDGQERVEGTDRRADRNPVPSAAVE